MAGPDGVGAVDAARGSWRDRLRRLLFILPPAGSRDPAGVVPPVLPDDAPRPVNVSDVVAVVSSAARIPEG
jgi:hypothetical protein